MDRIDGILDAACEDQRPMLRKFHGTGSWDDAARVHYESCSACMAALEAISVRHAQRPVAAAVEGNRPWVTALYVGVRILPVIAIGALLLTVASPFMRDDAKRTDLERMEARVVFVRMPGRPKVCVAALRGVGGYGPTFLGASPCKDVRERVTFDEGISARLGQAAVMRIEGTDACLAYYDGSERFALPCGDD